LLGVLDPPAFMRLFPRTHFGQFCSANAMWRSISGIIFGMLIGVFLDVCKHYQGSRLAYCWLPVWQWFFFLLELFFVWKVYRSWLRHGGDLGYEPPMAFSGSPLAPISLEATGIAEFSAAASSPIATPVQRD
jgi:hypothetical protein